jgi:hypothetical protein
MHKAHSKPDKTGRFDDCSWRHIKPQSSLHANGRLNPASLQAVLAASQTLAQCSQHSRVSSLGQYRIIPYWCPQYEFMKAHAKTRLFQHNYSNIDGTDVNSDARKSLARNTSTIHSSNYDSQRHLEINDPFARSSSVFARNSPTMRHANRQSNHHSKYYIHPRLVSVLAGDLICNRVDTAPEII